MFKKSNVPSINCQVKLEYFEMLHEKTRTKEGKILFFLPGLFNMIYISNIIQRHCFQCSCILYKLYLLLRKYFDFT